MEKLEYNNPKMLIDIWIYVCAYAVIGMRSEDVNRLMIYYVCAYAVIGIILLPSNR